MNIKTNNNVEYWGINIENNIVSNIKTYYVWDERDFPIIPELSVMLKPFDYGLRNFGANYSVSSFIKKPNIVVLRKCVDLISNNYNISINSGFVQEFCALQQFSKNIHYDPIISFKYKQSEIIGTSFYITALKDKTLVLEYLEQVISYYLNEGSKVVDFIRRVVEYRFADMFQVAWDFDSTGLKQNKVYLKIKKLDSFLKEMDNDFPFLKQQSIPKGSRLCEIAFVISNKDVKSYNLYYKPL